MSSAGIRAAGEYCEGQVVERRYRWRAGSTDVEAVGEPGLHVPLGVTERRVGTIDFLQQLMGAGASHGEMRANVRIGSNSDLFPRLGTGPHVFSLGNEAEQSKYPEQHSGHSGKWKKGGPLFQRHSS